MAERHRDGYVDVDMTKVRSDRVGFWAWADDDAALGWGLESGLVSFARPPARLSHDGTRRRHVKVC
jgi:hypothetical protein